jgi:hypothetical protein
VVRRAIYAVALVEENQQLMPWVPCSTTPAGGILKVSERPSVDRRGSLSLATFHDFGE